MRCVTADASMSAISRSRPPQRGHAGTSKPNARRIRSAQPKPPSRWEGDSVVRTGVSVALVSAVAAAVCRCTTSPDTCAFVSGRLGRSTVRYDTRTDPEALDLVLPHQPVIGKNGAGK